jgi:hypothetical protein
VVNSIIFDLETLVIFSKLFDLEVLTTYVNDGIQNLGHFLCG